MTRRPGNSTFGRATAPPELTEHLKAQPIRPGEGAIGRAAADGAPVQVTDLLRESGPAAFALWEGTWTRGLSLADRRTACCDEKHILGGLVVVRREAGNFSKEIVSLVEAFATQSALAVRNAKLFEEQRRASATCASLMSS